MPLGDPARSPVPKFSEPGCAHTGGSSAHIGALTQNAENKQGQPPILRLRAKTNRDSRGSVSTLFMFGACSVARCRNGRYILKDGNIQIVPRTDATRLRTGPAHQA